MKEIKQGLIIFIIFSLLTGIIYPGFITLAAKIIWKEKANGSLIKTDGTIIGSKLIGQKFTSPGYFHGRPSTVDYKGNISGASNLSPTSKKLIEVTKQEITKIKVENNIAADSKIPADLVLSSASGLDPHISLESALLQAPRVAAVRGLTLEDVKNLITKNTEEPTFKFLGQRRINVLGLNLDLDKTK